MAMDLNDTVIFVKVIEAGSFTAAARELRLPKTTVSRRVRKLEETLGAQLLHRTTRTLNLTEAGTTFFEQCRDIPRLLEYAEGAVGQLQGEPRGTLRVTASYSLMVNLIAPLLADFRRLYPDVRMDVVLSHKTLDLVADKIDLALRMGPLADSTLIARQLAVLPNRIYASPTYLAEHGEPAHPGELRRHSALVTRVARQGRGYAWEMSKDGFSQSFPLNVVIEADDPEVLKAPLFAGAGLMMATDQIMARHVADGSVRPVLQGWLGRCPELHAIFPQGRVQPPKLRAFVDFLVERLRDTAGSNVPVSEQRRPPSHRL